ncbi:MAG TPA: hypothetical protein VM165_09910 [Planctomycetaceae bacterium]|nr:hypothetical protein [Planctomycetaceae bacterium]
MLRTVACRSWSSLTVIALVVFAGLADAAQPPAKPNVIFILADDKEDLLDDL